MAQNRYDSTRQWYAIHTYSGYEEKVADSIRQRINAVDMADKIFDVMVPKEKQAAFLVEFESTLPALYDKMAGVMMTEYTHDDVKAILKFYETPVGKKMTDKSGVIAEKNLAASQEWAMGLQGMMMKYMQ